jgi:hypothetical protein
LDVLHLRTPNNVKPKIQDKPTRPSLRNAGFEDDVLLDDFLVSSRPFSFSLRELVSLAPTVPTNPTSKVLSSLPAEAGGARETHSKVASAPAWPRSPPASVHELEQQEDVQEGDIDEAIHPTTTAYSEAKHNRVDSESNFEAEPEEASPPAFH